MPHILNLSTLKIEGERILVKILKNSIQRQNIQYLMSMYKYPVLKIQWLLKFKIRLNRLNRTVYVYRMLYCGLQTGHIGMQILGFDTSDGLLWAVVFCHILIWYDPVCKPQAAGRSDPLRAGHIKRTTHSFRNLCPSSN